MTAPPPLWLALPLVGVLVTGCERHEPEWGAEDHVEILAVALEAIRAEVSPGDTLFVDPLPRLLDEAAPGSFRMGDFNPFGDPNLSSAIARTAAIAACTRERGGGCSRTGPQGFALVSEVFRAGPRDALLLASYVEVGEDGLRTTPRFVQLRHRRQGWSVSRLQEGDRIEARRSHLASDR